MDIQALAVTIAERIEKLQEAEKVTKAELSAISRELLLLVGVHGQEVTYVNYLLNVLTPMNKQTAIHFFNHFLPNIFNEKTVSFTNATIKKKKTLDAKAKDLTAFLDDENNDIWSWAKENVKLEKTKDFKLQQKLESLINAIDKAEENPEDYASIDMHIDMKTVMRLLDKFSEVSDVELNVAEEEGEQQEAA